MADDSPSIWDQINGAMNDGTILNAISNPLTSGLAAMAKSFGESSMPTRMPTPFMAALGKATGSALEGVGQGQALQKGGLQLQQQKMLMDYYKNAYGGTGAGGSPMGMPGGGSNYGGQQYLSGMSPPELIQQGRLYAAAGQPAVAAKLFSMAENAGGGPGYVAGTGGFMRTAGGAADPRQIATTHFTEKSADTAGANSQGKPEPYDIAIPDSNGIAPGQPGYQPTSRKQNMTPDQARGVAGAGGSVMPGTGQVADPFPGWARKINGGENATGDPNAKNQSGPGGTATSSAVGNGQFLEGTWPGVIRAVRPDLAAGKSDKELLPLRGIPELAQSATEQYARMNASQLANSGLPVTGGTLALAHFLGPAGASTVLKASPDAPISMLPGMGPVVAANPTLRNMTAGGLVRQYQSRMGGNPAPDSSQVAGPGAPQGQQAAPLQMMPGIAGAQKTELTPEQTSNLKVETDRRAAAATEEGKNSQGLPQTYKLQIPDVNGVQPGQRGYISTTQDVSLTPVQARAMGGHGAFGGIVGGSAQVLTSDQQVQRDLAKAAAEQELARHAPINQEPGVVRINDPVKAATEAGNPNVLMPSSQGRGTQEEVYKTYKEAEKTALAARDQLQEATLLKDKLHELGSTGPATPFLANLSRYAEQAGVSPETIAKWKLPPGAPETEAAALANGLVMEIAKQKFPGRITNADLNLAKTTKPSPEMPLAAADFLIDNTILPRAKRDVDRFGSVVHLTNPKHADYEPGLASLSSRLYEFDEKHPLSSYTPAMEPKKAPSAPIDKAAARAEAIRRGLIKE